MTFIVAFGSFWCFIFILLYTINFGVSFRPRRRKSHPQMRYILRKAHAQQGSRYSNNVSSSMPYVATQQSKVDLLPPISGSLSTRYQNLPHVSGGSSPIGTKYNPSYSCLPDVTVYFAHQPGVGAIVYTFWLYWNNASRCPILADGTERQSVAVGIQRHNDLSTTL